MISAVPLSVFYSFQFCLTFFFSSVQSFSPFVSFQILNLHMNLDFVLFYYLLLVMADERSVQIGA
ncbi:hypothetical protein V6Z11_D02G152200 [Gossypium hirsutum]